MSIQNLIIYKFTSLFQILEELALDLNFKIIFADKEKSLKDKVHLLVKTFIFKASDLISFVRNLIDILILSF